MVKTQDIDVQLPGLGDDYNYFDGMTEVYGLKGGNFLPDALFTLELRDNIRKLLLTGWETGEKTWIWEVIQETCIAAGVAWKAHVPPTHRGAHPDNRGKFGIDGVHSQNLGNDILKVGWSPKKSADPSCLQAPPEPWLTHAKQSNQALCNLSDGLIPELAQCGHLSMGGGHTNCFLRQGLGGVRSLHDNLKDKHGNLNADALTIGRPAFKEALEQGIVFTVFHWQTPFFWPSLPMFAQGALNIVVAGGQGEVEIMLTLHGLSKSTRIADPTKKIDWKPLEEFVCQTMPVCKSWAKSLSTYVDQNSGGPDGELINELSDYAKAFHGSGDGLQRIIGGEFFDRINSLNWGSGAKFPYVKHALLEAQLASPSDKMQSGHCRLLMPSMLSELVKKDKRTDVLQAEKTMTEARTVCTALKLKTSDRIKFIGPLDVRLVSHLLKKGKDFESTVFKSQEDILKVRPPHVIRTHALPQVLKKRISVCTHMLIHTCILLYNTMLRKPQPI